MTRRPISSGPTDNRTHPARAGDDELAALAELDPEEREKGLARAFGLIALGGLALVAVVLGLLALALVRLLTPA